MSDNIYNSSNDDIFDTDLVVEDLDLDAVLSEDTEESLTDQDQQLLNSLKEEIQKIDSMSSIVFPSLFDSMSKYFQTHLYELTHHLSISLVCEEKAQQLSLPLHIITPFVEAERNVMLYFKYGAFVDACLNSLSELPNYLESKYFSNYFYNRLCLEQKTLELYGQYCIETYKQVAQEINIELDEGMCINGVKNYMSLKERQCYGQLILAHNYEDIPFHFDPLPLLENKNKTIGSACSLIISHLDNLVSKIPR